MLCSICYAHTKAVKFLPCLHQSCRYVHLPHNCCLNIVNLELIRTIIFYSVLFHRIERFLSRITRMVYLPSSFLALVSAAENGLLAAVISDSFHVLRPIFPPILSRCSGLRKHAHLFFLPTKDIYSFIPRVIYILTSLYFTICSSSLSFLPFLLVFLVIYCLHVMWLSCG